MVQKKKEEKEKQKQKWDWMVGKQNQQTASPSPLGTPVTLDLQPFSPALGGTQEPT